MDKRYIIVAIAAAFTGAAWRLDHAELVQKAENIESVSQSYVAERAGTPGFFVMNLSDSQPHYEGEISLSAEKLRSRFASDELKRFHITADSEIVLCGGSEEETARAAERLMKLLNRSRTVIKKLEPEKSSS
jgi:hypothetical protein